MATWFIEWNLCFSISKTRNPMKPIYGRSTLSRLTNLHKILIKLQKAPSLLGEYALEITSLCIAPFLSCFCCSA
uniref:Uncharacterized protein n=1 Tax=Rhizophora mucronata TaxID=61149 RepID=A0A2P2J5K3_RHIMU